MKYGEKTKNVSANVFETLKEELVPLGFQGFVPLGLPRHLRGQCALRTNSANFKRNNGYSIMTSKLRQGRTASRSRTDNKPGSSSSPHASALFLLTPTVRLNDRGCRPRHPYAADNEESPTYRSEIIIHCRIPSSWWSFVVHDRLILKVTTGHHS
ncbi:hypothetical protein EVAR_28902_1 [Eumeta japonica]|uniref:Uncharacterized protein n=1 Tax=Eumeta variegata TaxID=151549 RepID=A0A4C1X056_EUMVA|nr:hypothetical protein EVAR_28902_1 [Eumeta japonica]